MCSSVEWGNSNSRIDLASLLLRKLAVAPQAYARPKVLAWGQGPTFLWPQISPAVPARILPDKYWQDE